MYFINVFKKFVEPIKPYVLEPHITPFYPAYLKKGFINVFKKFFGYTHNKYFIKAFLG